jgi:hypothetical protein
MVVLDVLILKHVDLEMMQELLQLLQQRLVLVPLDVQQSQQWYV